LTVLLPVLPDDRGDSNYDASGPFCHFSRFFVFKELMIQFVD
jgi:hypothetical protein